MKNTKIVTKDYETIDFITCDRCQKVIFTDDEFELQEMCLIHFTGGMLLCLVMELQSKLICVKIVYMN